MSNPREKAIELVNKFSHFTNQEKWELKNYYAMECALIAVDEILNLMIKEFKWDVKHNGNIEYWQEVKQAIQEL
jgi:hypothetical protein